MPEYDENVVNGSGQFGDPQYDSPAAGLVPVIVSITPSTANPGAKVHVTVYMNETAGQDQPVNIDGSPDFWCDLPDQVLVREGNSTVTFGTKLSSTARDEGFIDASCNGGSAQGEAWSTNAETRAAA